MNEPSAGTRWMDRAFDGGIVIFAVWTVCTHAAVVLGGSLNTALMLALPAFAVSGLVAWRLGRPAAESPDAPPAGGARERPSDGSSGKSDGARWSRGLIAVGAAACALGVLFEAPLAVVWSIAAAAVAFACARELAELVSNARSARPASPIPASGRLLFALAVGCAVLVLVAHRPDADDSFYLNLAVAAVDAPDAPLLANDTLHGIPGVPLPLPVYRVHSFEPGVAVIARASGLPVLDIAHLFLPVLFALFLPFLHARVLRQLVPRAWPLATGLSLGFLLFSGFATHGWASFGLLRLHQGKGLLLTLLLPAILFYALDFARRGGWGAWLRLAAAQVAAVGVSASALWLAPLVAGPALIAGVDLRSGGWRRIALGVTASLYVVIVALTVRAETIAAFRDAPVPSPEMALDSLRLFRQALRAVLSPGATGAFLVFVALGAGVLAREPVTRRLLAFSAACTLVLWNPFAADWIAAQLTSAATYWRVLWLLPMPFAFAVALSAPADWWQGVRARLACLAAAVLLFGGALALTPRALAISPANQVRIDTPGWKVPASEFEIARRLAGSVHPSETVLAPRRVAPWLTTLHAHPVALVVRAEYLPVLHEKLGDVELRRRMKLMRLVSGGRDPGAAAALREALESGELAALAVSRTALASPELPKMLRETGFQKIHENADYEVWRRGEAAEPGGSL